ncbi:aromatic-ring-hydroxylating dioxygenase subunit beta [Sphingopyxis lindanitolerans]|jgi:3-phenylpropionate/cinnamic acid dioxygenase small subunit|uniref:Aromatic-ring-hydroxylating dioxygenase subunit beta n=1 Tax=Sphingopyxis lindanitolerans TaxID=2054227 RepID=A0A2S8B7W5_9SPHN|nr:aromatic-ring-hydroxylating dioxygenase subunit beta [Sphingopyxis lindanitolerans]PQM28403.1 aromatic-ring-hydroxylating dioxygenase subunit beta [Sphingopyxis lindanitolerans]
MTRLTLDELARLDELQSAYMSALDGKKMRSWLDTFEDDPSASYICIARNDVESGLRVAMMLDDCRDRLIDRCTFIEDIWAGTFQDYRTRHFVQRVHAGRRADGLVDMVSNFSVIFTPDDTGLPQQLAAGTYEDIIRMEDDQCRFLSRNAVTDNAVVPRYLVFPL